MFKIYDENQKKSENKDVYLKFKKADNGVIICAVDENGKEFPASNLILFENDGYIKRFASVNPGLGFRLNDFSQIAVEGNADKFKTEDSAKEVCLSCSEIHE